MAEDEAATTDKTNTDPANAGLNATHNGADELEDGELDEAEEIDHENLVAHEASVPFVRVISFS